jgi:hypothetical protein
MNNSRLILCFQYFCNGIGKITDTCSSTKHNPLTYMVLQNPRVSLVYIKHTQIQAGSSIKSSQAISHVSSLKTINISGTISVPIIRAMSYIYTLFDSEHEPVGSWWAELGASLAWPCFRINVSPYRFTKFVAGYQYIELFFSTSTVNLMFWWMQFKC